MRKMQGMVLRVEERHVVVVTDEGDFLRIRMPARRPLPGQTLEIPVKQPRAFRPYLAVAAILVMLIAFSALRPLAISPAVASVALDMTPSVELTVNKDNVVIRAEAHNPEGENLLQQLEVKDLDVYRAVNLITAKAAEMNFFKPEGKNLVFAAVVPLRDEENTTSINKDEIMQVIHDEMSNRKYDGYVVVNQTGKEIHRQAEEEGLSVNRYLVLEKSREQGKQIAPETARSAPLPELMEAARMDVQQAFPGSWCEVSEGGWGMGHMGGMGFSPVPAVTPSDGSAGQDGSPEDNVTNGGSPQPAPGDQGGYPWQGMRPRGPMGPMGPMNPGYNQGGTPWSDKCD